nr:lysine-rich arabinogalactan protein 18 [Arachis hypogaea]
MLSKRLLLLPLFLLSVLLFAGSVSVLADNNAPSPSPNSSSANSPASPVPAHSPAKPPSASSPTSQSPAVSPYGSSSSPSSSQAAAPTSKSPAPSSVSPAPSPSKNGSPPPVPSPATPPPTAQTPAVTPPSAPPVTEVPANSPAATPESSAGIPTSSAAPADSPVTIPSSSAGPVTAPASSSPETSQGPASDDSGSISSFGAPIVLWGIAVWIEASPMPTPIVFSLHLPSSGSKKFEVPKLYKTVVGSLQYATITRPDLSYAMSKISQFMHYPLVAYWKVAKCVLRYLQETKEHGLLIRKCSDYRLYGFNDSDWAADLEDRRSVSDFCVFLGTNLVSRSLPLKQSS